jgi:hypothetical protein
MIGDLHGPGSGASQPLPPAYTRSAAGRPSFAPGEQRPAAPFFALGANAPEAAEARLGADRTVVPIVDAAEPPMIEPPIPLQAARVTPPTPLAQTVASGTIPADAIYMPDAEIPKRRVPEPEPDFGGSSRRPLSVSDAAIMIAARLELLSARLKLQGLGALEAGYAGDPLDAALAGLISGYIAGRAR